MKAMRIDLTPFVAEGQQVQYPVKETLANILISPMLKLNASELLLNFEVRQEVLKADGAILLSPEHYQRAKNAMDGVQGFSGSDVEFVQRIMNAQEVEIESKS